MRNMPVLHGGTPNIPSDHANAIAFDADGNLYVGTQCDGLAIAQAADNYTTWRVITGPDRMSTVPRGEGLPTNLINDVLVTRDGTLFVATMLGVAESRDRDRTLTYSRGADWSAKVRGLYGGPSPGWTEAPRGAGGRHAARPLDQAIADIRAMLAGPTRFAAIENLKARWLRTLIIGQRHDDGGELALAGVLAWPRMP